MEVFDLTRGTTTGTVRVPAKAGETAQFKIRSTKAKKVNGKSQTPERINFTYSYANQAVVRASWEEDPSNAELYIVTLLVIRTNTANTEDNTTVPFTQNESGNVLNLTVVQEAAAITYEYFIIGKPQDGIMVNDPATLVFESHFGSTNNSIIFQVLKVGYQGSTIISQEIVGSTDGFTAYSRPINDGFRLGRESGVDETSIFTIGGSSGKWFGTINVSFTYGSISGSNDIELYQR